MKIDLYGLWSRILSPGCPMRRILRGETERRLLIDFQPRPLAETSLKTRDAQKAFIAKNLLKQRIKLLGVGQDGWDGISNHFISLSIVSVFSTDYEQCWLCLRASNL